ncbi:MAG: hypothetical protein FWD60_00225 [Candidatus Azobacteroides sp.]|nr:hypothetical protein [Candidatus Azobacteroides sp.]
MGKFIFDCEKCQTRCDGKSKGVYDFKNDAELSEKYENLLISEINRRNCVVARKCIREGYPDIELLQNDQTVGFIEVKFQQRTFMTVRKHLPEGNLQPSETLALNQSDLLRYFDIYQKDKLPLFVVWGLKNRPCIVPKDKVLFFYQRIELLEKIYDHYKDKRRFRRASGSGDVVNGVHKGVVVNWHFSLAEFMKFRVDEFIQQHFRL